jgi:two-component system, sensor histidine kinase
MLSKLTNTSSAVVNYSRIDNLRKRLFIEGSARTPLIAVFGIWIIGAIAADSLGWLYVAPWAVLTSGFLLLRMIVLKHWLDQPDFNFNQTKVGWFVAGSGALITLPMAAGCLYNWASLGDADKALLSMVLIGWISGGLTSQTAYPKWSLPWVAPLFLTVIVGWLLTETPIAYAIALAVVLTATLMISGLINGAKALEASLVAQEENRHLASVVEQQKILVENALASKSSFLAAASHDLRQPALGIAMLVSALKEAKTIDAAKAIGATAEKAVDAMSRILDSLLEFSRLDSGQVVVSPLPTRVSQVLSSLMEEFKPHLRPAVRFEKQLLVESVEIDPQLFEQIARNLISNAIKFTYAGKILIKSYFVDHHLFLEISDSGVGIPAQDRERVFEEYFQVRNPTRDRTQGLGLGLSIVKKSVAMLGGTVEVQSQIGQGTTVHVSLPAVLLTDSALPLDSIAATVQAPEQLEATVLLIDDDPIVRESFSAALEIKSVRVLAASNAEQAIAYLENTPNLKTAFVDYQISDMYDGIRLITVLRQRWPELTYHLITGDPRLDVLDAAARAQVKLLIKPVPLNTVVELAKR